MLKAILINLPPTDISPFHQKHEMAKCEFLHVLQYRNCGYYLNKTNGSIYADLNKKFIKGIEHRFKSNNNNFFGIYLFVFLTYNNSLFFIYFSTFSIFSSSNL